MKICVSCGQLNSSDAEYCINCGKQSFDNSGEVVCPHCGEINSGESVYCILCGSPLREQKQSMPNETAIDSSDSTTVPMIATVQPAQRVVQDEVTISKVDEMTETRKLENPICPNCKTELSITDVFCPSCGQLVSHLNQNKLVKRKICSKCGKPNNMDEQYCSYCFADLSQADVDDFMVDFVDATRKGDKAIKQTVLKSSDGKKYKVCHDCGAINDFDAVICARCGQKIATEFRKKYCFKCGEENAYDAKFCVKCQYSFNAKTFGQMQGTWKCSCGEINEKENAFCVKCGSKRPPISRK